MSHANKTRVMSSPVSASITTKAIPADSQLRRSLTVRYAAAAVSYRRLWAYRFTTRASGMTLLVLRQHVDGDHQLVGRGGYQIGLVFLDMDVLHVDLLFIEI